MATIAQLTLVTAALLCALTAGFLFAFAVVVMPGIRTLSDADFLRAFQVIDRVIQDNNPLFLLVWVGSVLAVVGSVMVALSELAGVDRLLVLLAATGYVACVQVPTFIVNIPLNNRLKPLDVGQLDDRPPSRPAASLAPPREGSSRSPRSRAPPGCTCADTRRCD
jgi:uncharacterized membrane protein